MKGHSLGGLNGSCWGRPTMVICTLEKQKAANYPVTKLDAQQSQSCVEEGTEAPLRVWSSVKSGKQKKLESDVRGGSV